MKYNIIEFDSYKNDVLKATRGINFDDAIKLISLGYLIDDIVHKNKGKYPKQRILIINFDGYCYVVPYVEDDKREVIFLKTVYPSRYFTKVYLIGSS